MFLKGHDFSRAVRTPKYVRLQPLRDGFISLHDFFRTLFRPRNACCPGSRSWV